MIQRFLTILTAFMLAACGVSSCGERGNERAADELRLVVINPALAQTVDALGHGDAIVGRHGADSFTDADTPVAANDGRINVEVIARLDATHLVLQSTPEGLPGPVVEIAEMRGIEIIELPLLTLGDVREAVVRLDDALNGGRSEAGAALLASMDEAWRARPEVSGRAGRTLVLAWTDPPGVMGPGSFHYEMLASMGVDVMPESGAAYIEWSVERVVRSRPDTIVLLAPGSTETSASALLGPLSGAGLPAETDGRLIVVRDRDAYLPGPSLVDVAIALARGLEALPRPE